MLELLVLAIYLSFTFDFVLFPIPSEASTVAITQRERRNLSWKTVIMWIAHMVILITWLTPLLVTLMPLMNVISAPERPTLVLSGAGIFLAILGRIITVSTSVTMTKSRASAKSPVILTNGLFALSRHPIVLGLHLTLAGLVLTTGMDILIIPFLFTLVYFDQKLNIEEKLLTQTHGTTYKQYLQRTRRYLNWPFSKSR